MSGRRVTGCIWEVLEVSLGSLLGPRGALGVTGGVPGHPGGSLGTLGGSLGGPCGVPGGALEVPAVLGAPQGPLVLPMGVPRVALLRFD